jgi:O-antigen/teichoic acid export membrane protein
MRNTINKIINSTYKLFLKEEPAFEVNLFFKNLSLVMLGFGISALLGLVTQILAGRILGPLEYGKYFLIQAVSSFLYLPMLVCINIALTKYGAEENNFDGQKKIISTAYILFLFLSVISFTVLLSFSKIISGIFSISLEFFIYAIILSFLYSSYLISISIAQGLKKMKVLSILQIIYGMIGILAFLFFIYLKIHSFKAIFFASAINYFVVFALSIIIFRNYFSLSFDWALAKKILVYGFYTSVGGIMAIVYFNFDRIIINKYFGAGEVGVYGSYYVAFVASASFIFNAFNLVFFPTVSGSKKREMIFEKINKVTFKFAAASFVFILLFGVVVVKLYGNKYEFNFLLCLLFALGSVAVLVNAIYAWYARATGEKGIKIATIGTIAIALVNVAVNLFLTPVIGFTGAAIAIIVSYPVSIFIILRSKNYYHLDKTTTDLTAGVSQHINTDKLHPEK